MAAYRMRTTWPSPQQSSDRGVPRDGVLDVAAAAATSLASTITTVPAQRPVATAVPTLNTSWRRHHADEYAMHAPSLRYDRGADGHAEPLQRRQGARSRGLNGADI